MYTEIAGLAAIHTLLGSAENCLARRRQVVSCAGIIGYYLFNPGKFATRQAMQKDGSRNSRGRGRGRLYKSEQPQRKVAGPTLRIPRKIPASKRQYSRE